MSKFIKDLITGTSNLDYELSRVLWLAGGVAFIAYGGFHLFKNGVFNPLEFGGGFGALMAGGGFGTAAKDRAKNEADTPPQPAQVLATGPITATMADPS